MPCWTEPDLLAARSSAHRDLPQPLPFPRHGRRPCRPSGVPPAAPSQRLSALGLWEAAPRGAEGTRQNLTPQQSPLPVCNLTGRPCLLDRDPGENFLSRKKEVVARLLGYLLCPPSVSIKPLCQGPLATHCAVLAPRGWRRRCVCPGPPHVFPGHVNKRPGQPPPPPLPALSEAKLAGGGNSGIHRSPEVQTFPSVNVIF